MSRHTRRAVLGALIAAAVATAAPFAQPAVTVDALLSAPFPSEIVAAPTGGHVAWVLNAAGARNVWVASAPDFSPRQLTPYSGDDGQDITGLTWSRDGRTVLYVRGGGANRAGEIPNPAITSQPAEQAIFAVDIETRPASAPAGLKPTPSIDAATPTPSGPRRLATGNSPAVSPTGQVAYLSRGQVWTAALAGTAKPEQLFTIRGNAGSLRWAPDGTKLAFVSGRGTHSFIGVYDIAAKSLRYLDPSIDLDANPSWSPDGSRLVHTRIPATGEIFMFAPRREALPWSIRVVDVASGQAAEVWKADAGRGSVFQGVNAPEQLLWAAGDRLVFPWERDGWIHLYALPIAGGQATLLTPGGFEVEHVTISPDRTRVVYSSNQDDIDRRHLWSVPVDGSARPVALTRGAGAEWMPAIVEANTVAFIRSDGKRPAEPAVINLAAGGGGARS